MKGKKTINFQASEDEIRRFQKNVKAANQILRRYTERQARITGKPREDIDPLFFKRSGNLSQFQSRKEFLDALADSEKVSRKGYMRNIQEIQKENYIESLKKVFGDEADDVIAAVRRTGARKLADLQSRDILPHTGFVYYDPSGGEDKLDEIREALIDAGIMREKDNI